jgi:hypothetical protein
MFPRVTHPSATPVLLRAFDLHVLSLPPAFALSQDQTLKLDENLNRPVTSRLTRSTTTSFRSFRPGQTWCCTFYENVYRRSLFRPRLLWIAPREDTVRKDLAVHVSLSPIHLSNSPDPRVRLGPESPHPTARPESHRSLPSDRDRVAGSPR